MDVMKIRSKFVRGIVSRFIEKAIQKQTGTELRLSIQNIEVFHEEGNTINFKLAVEGEASEKDLQKLLGSLGL